MCVRRCRRRQIILFCGRRRLVSSSLSYFVFYRQKNKRCEARNEVWILTDKIEPREGNEAKEVGWRMPESNRRPPAC